MTSIITRSTLNMLTLLVAVGTTSSAAKASLTLVTNLSPDRSINLIQNGSFEGHPTGATSVFYWGVGTTLTPQATPASWTGVGGSSNYAGWGNTTFNWSSAALPHGAAALYFGNQYAAAISETPAFHPDGTVTFTNPAVITPDPIGYVPAVTLSQTVVGLNTGHRYGLSFWASGEHATQTTFGHDGIFGLDVTGSPTVYLAAPSGRSNLGPAHDYQFEFIPTASSATFTFTNWGHLSPGAPFGNTVGWTLPWTTELVLDDVVLNDLGPVPEPGIGGLLATAVLYVGLRRSRRETVHPE